MKKYINIKEEDIQKLTTDNYDDYWELVDPMWYKVNIYETYSNYEKSLEDFTQSQAYLHAMEWLIAEVNNGGFDQFFYNSTGIVWKNAYKGFVEMGCDDVVTILDKVQQLYGKEPSEDREKRWEEMDNNKDWEDKIDDLGSEFHNLEGDYYDKMVEYIKNNPKEFLFEGEIDVEL